MNPKISGQSSKSNYKNNGSSASAVFYDEHDLREYLDEALELGAQGEQMQFFDMEGHVVTAAEVLDKVDRHHSGLHKSDAKFYCIMLDPSDPEIAAMGEDLTERLANGQQYVFDIMDAYARNFHREGIEDRHNLTAYAIPHLYKGEEKKDQLHWHIIVARKDASNKYKLSPLTNHRSTTNGVVKGGFDRVAFDQECEQLFDKRFGYERKVEESFAYCLAQKKGTPEQKAEQTQRLTEQNKPDLEAAVSAFLNHRVAQLAAEAAVRAEKERLEKEEAARKEAARLDRIRRNEFWNDYHSKYRPEYIRLKEACDKSFELYRTAKEKYGICNEAIAERYDNLRSAYEQMNILEAEIKKATSSMGTVKAVSSLIFVMNPLVGILLILLCGILDESERDSRIEARRELRSQAAAIRDSINELKAEQAALRQDKTDRLQVYAENKEAKAALQTEINNLKAALDKPLQPLPEARELQSGVKKEKALEQEKPQIKVEVKPVDPARTSTKVSAAPIPAQPVTAPEPKPFKEESMTPDDNKRKMKNILQRYAKHVEEKEQAQKDKDAQQSTNSLSGSLAAYLRRNEILEVFKQSADKDCLKQNLAEHGLSMSVKGVEDITITAGGKTPFSIDASKFGKEYLQKLLYYYQAATMPNERNIISHENEKKNLNNKQTKMNKGRSI